MKWLERENKELRRANVLLIRGHLDRLCLRRVPCFHILRAP